MFDPERIKRLLSGQTAKPDPPEEPPAVDPFAEFRDPLDALDAEVDEHLAEIEEHITKATHEVRAALDLYLANAHDRHPDERAVWEIIEHVGHLHVRIVASTVPEDDVVGFSKAWVDANTTVMPRYGLDEPIGCTTEVAIVTD